MTSFLAIAFAACPPPSPGDLVPHQCEECSDLRRDLSGHTVWSLPPAAIQEHFGDPALLSPSAFRYFLPAYLQIALNCTPGTKDEMVRQFVLYSLVPQPDSDHSWYETRFSMFTPPEVAAIVQALEVLATDPLHAYDHDEARQALTVWRARLHRHSERGA